MGQQSSKTIATIAAISILTPTTALPQQVGAVGVAGPTTAAGTILPRGVKLPAGTVLPPIRRTISQSTTNTGGSQFDITVRSTATFDDNFPLVQYPGGSSYISDTNVTFGFSSITDVDDLSLIMGGTGRAADVPGRSLAGFEDPTVRFNYRRAGYDSDLALTGRYRKADREFLDPFAVEQEQLSTTQLIGDGGKQIDRNLGLVYRTGITAPIGLTLSLDHAKQTYEDVFSPSLIDTESNGGSARVNFRLSQVTNFYVDAGLVDYNASDVVQTSRRTTTYDVGVTHDFNPVLNVDARIGRTNVDEDTIFGSNNTDDTVGSLILTKSLPTGSVFASYDTTFNQNGATHNLRFGRDLQLPRGRLTGEIGAARTPGDNTHLVGVLRYNHLMANGNIALSAIRTVSTNNIDEDVVDTRVGLGYSLPVNNNGTVDLGVDWGRSESAGIGNAPTIELTTFRASYTHQLTQDWNVVGGAVIRHRTDDSWTSDADSNSVYVTLGRTFSFRP